MNPLPTPTAYPTVEAIDMPITAVNASDWSIWEFTDEAISIWNYEPTLGQVIQTAIIIILVISFMMILIKNLQQLQEN
jgi:hypothetical protein